MKLVKTSYYILRCPPGTNKWGFVLPPLAASVSGATERLRVYAKKVVLRNDFKVLYEGRNSVLLNGVRLTVRSGNPNALRFVEELNRLSETLLFTFDPYDGRVYVENYAGQPQTVGSDTLFGVLGFQGEITVPALGKVALGELDLAPPSEVMVIRMQGLSSSALEISAGEDHKSSDVLAVVGINVAPYGSFVYRDDNGLYAHYLSQRDLRDVKLLIENADGEVLVSNNSIVVVLGVEVWKDDEAELLREAKDQTEMARLGLIGASLAGGD